MRRSINSPWVITLILYLSLVIVPTMLGAYNEVWFRSFPIDIAPVDVVCAMLLALALLSLEVKLMSIALLTLRRINNKLVRISSSLALLIAFTAFQVFSWSGLYLYGSFPSLANAAFMLTTETSTFILHTTEGDLRRIERVILTIGGLGIALPLLFRRVRLKEGRAIAGHVRNELLIVLLVGIAALVGNAKPKNITLVLTTVASPEAAFARELLPDLTPQEQPDKRTPPLTQIAQWREEALSRRKELPDVFIVAIEALRADLLESKTPPEIVIPNISQVAKKAAVFSRAYAVAPETGYALKAILSARYPYEGDFRQRNYISDVQHETLLFDLFHSLGYKTSFFSATDWRATARLMERPSLDTYVDAFRKQRISRNDWVTRDELGGNGYEKESRDDPSDFAALDESTTTSFNEWVKTAPADKPLFGAVYLVSSHFPWIVRDPVHQLSLASPDSIKGDLSVFTSNYHGDPEELKRHYHNAAHQVDHFFGGILRTIQERQQHRPVVLVVVGDHGEALGQHGHLAHATSLFEEQVRIPLLVYDSRRQTHSVVDSVATQVDIPPTILAHLDLPPYNGHQTDSVMSPTGGTDRSIYLTLQTLTSSDGVIEWPFKGILDAKTDRLMVFNLQKDPTEHTDISQELPTISEHLREKIVTFKKTQKEYYRLPRAIKERVAPPSWR